MIHTQDSEVGDELKMMYLRKQYVIDQSHIKEKVIKDRDELFERAKKMGWVSAEEYAEEMKRCYPLTNWEK